MIYPKFSQRYLAVIVVCLILTFSALGAVFLIYLFNEGSSPLVLTSGGNGGLTILKTASSIIEGELAQDQQEKRNYLQQQRIVTMNSNENNDNNSEIPYENYELDENIDDADRTIDHQQQLQQQEEHRFMNNMKYKLYSITSSVDEKKMNDQQHNNNSAEDEINLELNTYTKDINGDDDDMSISATSTEVLQQQQNHNGAGTRDNFDTIYIDDFERINNYNNMHINKNRDQSKLISGVDEVVNTERSYINYFDAVVSNDDADDDIDSISDKKKENRRLQNDVDTEAAYSTATKATTSFPAADIAVVLSPTELFVAHKIQKEILKRDGQHISRQQKNDAKSNKINNSRRQQQQQKIQQKLHIKRIQDEENLDALYDNANSNYDIIEDDDDDEDKLINGGSGSGDFDTTNSKQNMKNNVNYQSNVAEAYDGNVEVDDFSDMVAADPETANFIKRISFKMFQRMGGKNNSKNKRNPQIKYLKTKNQTGGDKQRRINTYIDQQQQQQKTHSKPHNKRIAKNFDLKKKSNSTQQQEIFSPSSHNYNLSREIASNLTAAQLFDGEKFINRMIGASTTSIASAQPIETKKVETPTTALKFELNHDSKNVSKSLTRFTTLATSTTANKFLPFTAATVATRVAMLAAFAKDKNKQQPQQVVAINVASADMPTIGGGVGGSSNANSEAWSETRTRRIIGNVRKSEERSRQLLLCEEAGGGELCRMLFKGHLNE